MPAIDIGALMRCESDAQVDALLAQSSSDSSSVDGQIHQIIEELRAAATEWGFFYIANHGLTDAQMQAFQLSMRAFFQLPQEERNALRRHATNSRGYFDDELTKNKTDWKQGFDYAGQQEDGPADDAVYKRMSNDENQWPLEHVLPAFKTTMIQYFGLIEHISRRLLKVFAVALGEQPNFFDQFFHASRDGSKTLALDNNSSFLRLNHYPVAPNPESTMGVYHHTDAGALTVLLQDDQVASLQVLHRETQEWCLIPPRKDTFVINIGDMVQVWSNDKFQAPLHRVLANGSQERFSAPFFYNPSYDALVKPVVVLEGEKPKYRPLSWREFRLRRFQGDYADSGEEIQIGHFRIPTEAA